MTTASLEDIEFWWASNADRRDFGYVLPGYQPTLPNGDSPNPVYDDLIPIHELADWCENHDWINVHRNLNLYSGRSQDCSVKSGPLLFDFDNSDENLIVACSTTQAALRFLLTSYSLDPIRDCRTFFSGRKGFHIELRPGGINPDLLRTTGYFGRSQIEQDLIDHLRQLFGVEVETVNALDSEGTVLDTTKEAKRVNESNNVWSDNGVVRKMKMVFVPTDVILSGVPDKLLDELVSESTLE